MGTRSQRDVIHHKRRWLWGLLGLLLIAWGGVSCRWPGRRIKIVSSLPMQGSSLMQSQTMVNAIRMAVDEANGRAGAFRIEYDPWDDGRPHADGWDADAERQNAQRAVADPDVMVYIGPFNSGAARIAIPITNVANLVTISPSATYPGLTESGPYVQPGEPDVYYPNHVRNFCRLVPDDVIQVSAEVAWAQAMGVHTVFVVNSEDAYGAGLGRIFRDQAAQRHLQVSGTTIASAADFAPIVEQIRQARPDLVYFGGNTQNGAGALLKAMREAGLTARFMGSDGIRETAFLDAAGVSAEGAFASLGAMPVERLPAEAKEWFDRYRQAYQGDTEPYTLYAYEAARVSLAGIAQAGVKDRVAIRDAIMHTHDFHGVLGTWSFDANGDTSIRQVAGYQVHNHHFEFRQMLSPN